MRPESYPHHQGEKSVSEIRCVVEAAAPSRPIDRDIVGQGLLAPVLTSKYDEHTPLCRQTEILSRYGVDLSRALLSNWVDACCRLMAPLNDVLNRYVIDIGTCKLNGIDTQADLRHIMTVLMEWPFNRVAELLPWNVDLAS